MNEAGTREKFVHDEMEAVFQEWAYRAALFGAGLFMLLVPLDYISRQESFPFFTLLRLGAVAGLLLLSLLVRRSRRRFWRRLLVLLAVLLSSAIIETMILSFGGARSPYFAGQILLGVVTLGFLPTSLTFHNVIAATIQSVYCVPLLLQGEIAQPREFLVQNVLLFFVLGSTVVLSHFARAQLRSRIGLAYDLAEKDRLLETQVRKRTRQLADTLDEWRVTVDSTGDAIMLVNEEGRVARVNLACVYLSGRQFDQLVGSNAAEILSAIGLAPEMSPVEKVLRTGSQGRTEFRSAPLGRWFELTADPTRSGSVFLAGAVITVRDVTEVREMQQTIMAAGKEWEETFDSIQEGITIHDRDFRIRRFNSAAQRLVGGVRSLDEAPCHEIFHGTGCRIEGCPGEVVRSTGRPASLEFFEPALGRYLEVTCFPRPHGGFIHVVRDITELKRNVEEIRKAGMRLQQILERAPFGVFMVNADLVVEFANPAVLRITGYQRQHFVGGCMEDFPGCAELGMKEPILAALKGKPFRLGPKNFHCVDNDRRVIGRFTGIPLEEAGRRKVLIFVEDVTELKLAEEEQQRLNALLLQVQKMESIGTLASGISHDFNNILLAVIGLSDAAMEKLPEAHPARKDLEAVVGAAERGSNLVHQILAFSRQQDLQMVPLCVDTMVRETARLLEHILPRNIRLEVAGVGPECQVMADPVQLEQVLMNLAVNSRDAMPEGGTLSMRAGTAEVRENDPEHPGIPEGDYATVTVSDTGTGIDPQVLPRIFDPFFTTKDADKGTGLGLATVYGIVSQHGGGIRVESPPGGGARFTIYLPAAEEGVPGGRGIRGGSETVLVVEDDCATMGILTRQLASLGYRVLPAASGDEALEVYERVGGKVDALLCDAVIAGEDAGSVMEELRSRKPALRVIYISERPGEYLKRQGLVGDDGLLLAKALGPQKIARRLREELDRAVIY